MKFQSPIAEHRYAEIVGAARRTVVGLDFDGVLAPIVPEPEKARIHPDGPATLVALADQVLSVAVVTGRPARQAVALGDLDEVGDRIAERGHDLLVLGQYGNERWQSRNRRVLSPRPPKGLARFLAEVPDLLNTVGLPDVYVEEKGLAVAFHTRRLPDPHDALARLEPALRECAGNHGLVLEPGRMVIEVRAPGMDKGQAVRNLQREFRADGFVFVGDDLGDVAAFRAIIELRQGGMLGLLVCSASAEQPGLTELADVVVDGPDGVMGFLNHFAEAAARGTVAT